MNLITFLSSYFSNSGNNHKKFTQIVLKM